MPGAYRSTIQFDRLASFYIILVQTGYLFGSTQPVTFASSIRLSSYT